MVVLLERLKYDRRVCLNMIEAMLIKEAGLTEGEAKVYLAMLKLGSSTAGPIIESSGVANSIIYRLLNSLIEKGLVSYIIKDKTKHFQAEEPQKILEYIDERKQKLEQSRDKINEILPQLIPLSKPGGESCVRLYQGFKGFQNAYAHYRTKLKKGEEVYTWGIYPIQLARFHQYWQKDHKIREKLGIKVKLLFNKGTDPEIMRNRNSYKGSEARIMPTDIKTPAWFMVYKDVSLILVQSTTPIVVEIINQDIADTFKAYFDDFWRKTKPFK
jgi:DNA-binding MarR family transcriptional regulator